MRLNFVSESIALFFSPCTAMMKFLLPGLPALPVGTRLLLLLAAMLSAPAGLRAQAQTAATYVQPATTLVAWERLSPQSARATFTLVVLEPGRHGADPAGNLDFKIVSVSRDATPLDPTQVLSELKNSKTPADGILTLQITLSNANARLKGGDLTVAATLTPRTLQPLEPPTGTTTTGTTTPPTPLPPQPLSLTIKVPKAKLVVDKDAQGKALKLQHEVWAPWRGATSRPDSAPLVLQETGGVRAEHVTVVDTSAAVAAAQRLDTGHLVFGTSPASAQEGGTFTVEADDTLLLHPKVVGDFPVGDSEGLVKVRWGNQAEPTEFRYSLRVITTRWWIPFLTALGVFLGMLLRTLLPGHIAVSESRLRGIVLLRQLQEQGERFSTDPGYLRSRAAILQELQRHMQDPRIKAADLDAAIATATTGHTAAVAKLQQEVATGLNAVKTWQDALSTQWVLPAESAARLAQAHTQLDHALTLLQDRRDPLAAHTALEALVAGTLTHLVRFSADHRLGTQELLEKMVAEPAPVGPEGLQEIGEVLATAKAAEATARARVSQPRADAALTADELQTASVLHYWINDLADKLPGLALFFANAQAAIIETAGADRRAERDAAAAAVQKAIEPLRLKLPEILRAARPGQDGVQMLDTELSGFKTQWRDALLPLAAALPGAAAATAEQAVRAEVSTGKWAEAVAAAADPVAAAAAHLAMLRVAPPAQPRPLQQPPLRSPVPHVVPRPWQPALTLAAWEQSLREKISAATWLQSGLVAALFCILAWIFLAETWLGDWPQMGRLFLAAFFTDLGVDQFKKLAGQKPLPF